MRALHFLTATAFLIFLGCQTGKFQESEIAEPQRIRVDSPAGSQSGEPNLFVSPEGNLYLSWIEAVNDSIDKLCYSILEDTAWSKSVTIVEGKNWFVNWADFPSLVAMDNLMATHWLVKSNEGDDDYDIRIALSHDRGHTWNAPFVLHQDNVAAEHGFVTLLPLSENHIFAVWLDGRKAASDKDQKGEEDMSLQATTLDWQGNLQKEVMLDERVCECCQTDAALTDHGVVVVYRNRTEDEVRDIYIIRKQENGWSEPQPVYHDNWKITGCPVNGPAVAASGNTVAVAWFSAANEKEPKVQVAFSKNGGARFGDPVRVDFGKPLGRVDVVMLNKKSALVSWMEATSGGAAIQTMQVAVEGSKSPSRIIASTLASRASGFPVMEKAHDNIYFAWTQVDSVATVQTAYIPVQQILLNEDIGN